jgi:hypothetical protein
MTERAADPGTPRAPLPAQQLVVDRIVDARWAVLELDPPGDGAGGTGEQTGAGGTVTIPVSWLPNGVREGDVVQVRVGRADEANGSGSGGSGSGSGGSGEEGPELERTAAVSGSVTLHIVLDPAARAERAAQMEALRARIPRGPSGDLAL